jgi:hypothetical protein
MSRAVGLRKNNCKTFCEFAITKPKVGICSSHGLKADYVLSYKNAKLVVV